MDQQEPLKRREIARNLASLLGVLVLGTNGALAIMAQESITNGQAAVAESQTKPNDEPASVESIANAVRPSLVTIRVSDRDGQERGVGSGFVIDSSGLIATNFHVIQEGREFTVELWPNRKLKVLAIEASDRAGDLAILRVDTRGESLPSLELADADSIAQGITVLAFGNPLGLEYSVVQGIVSAVREIEGQRLIQLAMPIEPGNSGGPLIDLHRKVHGIVNMKSAIDDNLGFAIPVGALRLLQSHPNPIMAERWIQMGGVDDQRWTPLFGAQWSERSGVLQVQGMGNGFGGRSLCLSTQEVPAGDFDLQVQVKLDKESGAAGLVFHSDGDQQHYGFYPSEGKLRLSCFRGEDVFQWQVLEEKMSNAYMPGEWNRLRVHVNDGKLDCYVNEQLVVSSRDGTFRKGRVGVAKFRDTKASFRRFELREGTPAIVADVDFQMIAKMLHEDEPNSLRAPESIGDSESVGELDVEARRIADQLARKSHDLANQSLRLKQMAIDVQTKATVRQLLNAIESSKRLRATLFVAKLEYIDIEVAEYVRRVDRMADEIRSTLSTEAKPLDVLDSINRYLFRENGFHGGRDEYYHVANNQMNRVLEDREGMPIALSILYMEIGQRLGIDMEGVGLPGHFLVRLNVESQPVFIDAFEQGERLTLDQVANRVLATVGRPLDKVDLEAQDIRQIVTRILRNLIGSAQRSGDVEAMLRYAEALVAIHPQEGEFRLVRSSLYRQTGRLDRAIRDIDWLIDHVPPGLDVHELLRFRDGLQSELIEDRGNQSDSKIP